MHKLKVLRVLKAFKDFNNSAGYPCIVSLEMSEIAE